MQEPVSKYKISSEQLPFKLYHGTSTIFLKSINEHGLGAVNPVKEWKVLELAKRVLELSYKYLSDYKPFQIRKLSFENMVFQRNSGMNWQHGETYLSSTIEKATSYATSNLMGSEILTYTADFLKELLKRDIPDVSNKLYQDFPNVFKLLETSPSALLLEISGIKHEDLKSENGGSPNEDIEWINNNSQDEIFKILFKNFRLVNPIPSSHLKIYMINVLEWSGGPFGGEAKCNFHRINPEKDFSINIR